MQWSARTIVHVSQDPVEAHGIRAVSRVPPEEDFHELATVYSRIKRAPQNKRDALLREFRN